MFHIDFKSLAIPVQCNFHLAKNLFSCSKSSTKFSGASAESSCSAGNKSWVGTSLNDGGVSGPLFRCAENSSSYLCTLKSCLRWFK